MYTCIVVDGSLDETSKFIAGMLLLLMSFVYLLLFLRRYVTFYGWYDVRCESKKGIYTMPHSESSRTSIPFDFISANPPHFLFCQPSKWSAPPRCTLGKSHHVHMPYLLLPYMIPKKTQRKD
jgi:hypothetical protein